MGEESCLLVFCRAPGMEPGKTRLAAALGQEMTARIYEAGLLDTLEAALLSDVEQIIICYSPSHAGGELCDWLGQHGIVRRVGDAAQEEGSQRQKPVLHPILLWPQPEGDLGFRMAECLGKALQQGFRAAVLVGSDSPGLSARQINSGLNVLEGCDLVFGPALDGGFYLVGGISHPEGPVSLENSIHALFTGIGWSQPDTLRQVLRQARPMPLAVRLLEMWPDLDTEGDIPLVMRFLETYREAGQFVGKRVFGVLEEVVRSG